ncbi:hypothetical protein QP119_04390 [Corynebacterium frankenforstense]|uniref:hypothetical protein n=1 Tax=Corynebacterium frankenforstense TaxID=1230998 RepID=UPI00254A9951|nr:hypothetical protein [Corynebacterium frankenforstense]MDK6259662.1 hypothetical protein [Corynebacterium frankenforstense]
MSARDDREVPGAISDFLSSLTTSLEFFTDCRVELEITRLESINDFSIAPPRNEEEKGRPTSQLVALTAYDAIAEHPVALLGLDLNFRGFISDRHGDLTISQSTIAVWPLAKRRGTQLFRYDYLRKPGREIPAAYLQVAAHRDQFTHLLGFPGRGTHRSRGRAKRDLSAKVPSVAEYHFPLGGPRFRPCLEDILESLRAEFGLEVDTNKWKTTPRKARDEWHRIQLTAAILDDPRVAAEILSRYTNSEIVLDEEKLPQPRSPHSW